MKDSKDMSQEIQMLERSLERERRARKNAEDILRNKTFELLEANKRAMVNENRLRQALSASKQLVWEWNKDSGSFDLFSSDTDDSMRMVERHTLDQLLSTLNKSHQRVFKDHFNSHVAGDSSHFSVLIQRLSSRQNKLRWIKLTGQGIERDENGHCIRMLGTYKDVTAQTDERTKYEMVTRAFFSTARPTFIVDMNTLCIEANKTLYKLFNLKNEPASNQHLTDLLPLTDILDHQKNGIHQFDINVEQNNTLKALTIVLTPMLNQDEDSAFCIGYCAER